MIFNFLLAIFPSVSNKGFLSKNLPSNLIDAITNVNDTKMSIAAAFRPLFKLRPSIMQFHEVSCTYGCFNYRIVKSLCFPRNKTKNARGESTFSRFASVIIIQCPDENKRRYIRTKSPPSHRDESLASVREIP